MKMKLYLPCIGGDLGGQKRIGKRATDEMAKQNKVSKQGVVMTCSNCGESTHNRRTCKKPP